jgi:hypothetical protein
MISLAGMITLTFYEEKKPEISLTKNSKAGIKPKSPLYAPNMRDFTTGTSPSGLASKFA